MKDILIIGAGQLGSRHLQGAIKSHLPLNIVVVDPNINSLELAKNRASEVVIGNKSTIVKYRKNLQENMFYDLCIIATTANIRFKVFLELISKCTVKNIIFEKVLFQKESEYTDTENLLADKQINAWVNCPRRMNLSYQKIQTLLANETDISMVVTGSNWGLACNGIHFMDLFLFITQKSNMILDTTLLNEKVVASKRNGFYEVLGTLYGRDTSGNSIELHCSDDENISIEVKLLTKNYQIIIKETDGDVVIINSDQEVKEFYKPLYQSELTHLNIEEILEKGNSSLTTFNDSKNIHLPFIRSIKKHIEITLNEQLDACPIT